MAKPRRERTVLDEAKGLVHGDRNDSYGNPIHDFSRAAAMLNGLFLTRLQGVAAGVVKPEEFFSPNDPPKIHIITKLSRSMHSRKRDSWTDIAGYAETGDWTEEDMEAAK